ncbi:MAG: UDP-N-acetylmuramate:L-alanyl-gamma-D-glutamyl-meso-diaminopimelate ligase [Thermodesulfobacteriota bacterium]
MTLDLNRIPDRVQKIHLIAVCGTAMGALASMLKDMGYAVTGSDHNVYPPMSHFLVQKGIVLKEGFSGENIAYGPDLVVVGNAVLKDNPEVEMMNRMEIPYCSMPQAVNRFVVAGKKSILITGTHGKTTTSSIIAWLLFKAGLDPSFIIGGILKNFKSNYRLGKGPYVVIEGDEYDTAYFDKGPKFLHYDPAVALLTSVEFDHADIFKDLGHVKEAFGMFVSRMSPESMLLAVDNDENVNELIGRCGCRLERYGRDPGSTWRMGVERVAAPWTGFEIFQNGNPYHRFKTRLMGGHNLLNTLAAVAVADHLQIPKAVIAGALEAFEGIKRRQEIRGEKRGVTVMDDFAHHPTAVRETIRAVRPFCGSGRLVAVFEPRTNTSMRKVFQDVYPLAFDGADLVCIRKPPLLKKVPPAEWFSSEKLVADLKKAGRNAYFFEDTDRIIDFLVENTRSGDVVLIMSNGGFDNIHERLLTALSS